MKLYIDPDPNAETIKEGLTVGYLPRDIREIGSIHQLLVVTNIEAYLANLKEAKEIFQIGARPPDEVLEQFGVEKMKIFRFPPEQANEWRAVLRTLVEQANPSTPERNK